MFYRYKRLMSVVLGLILLFVNIQCVNASEDEEQHLKVLYINSYEEGYKWSDDIYDGMKSVFAGSDIHYDIHVEYMSTHLIQSEGYGAQLYDIYKEKYSGFEFDLIITSDDAAFNFMAEYGDDLFRDVPRFFCGVNSYDEEKVIDSGYTSGVIEGYDVGETIKLILNFHPETKHIYYVNDTSLTGRSIQKEFDAAIAEFDDIEFIPFSYELFEKNGDMILKPNSAIHFLIYTIDSKGNIYDYRYASNEIANTLDVPVYGQWDFSLGEGIIGGKLTSGFYQGETVAKLAYDNMQGKQIGLDDVAVDKTTQYMFDYNRIKEFNIDLEGLPEESKIVNYTKTEAKSILIINSYNAGLSVTDQMNKGIYEALSNLESEYTITHEYLDTKSNSEELYQYNLEEFLVKKYKDKKYDLIITVNDNAYNFVNKYYKLLFDGTPVVFGGVNRQVDEVEKKENFVGVVESLGFVETLEMALSLKDGLEKVVVINDKTATGQFNKQILEETIKEHDFQVEFEYWEELNMYEIGEKGSFLDENTIVLLLSFTEDKSNNNFTYSESISIISEAIDVPIFGIWDFYLGKGIVGGYLLNSYEHGREIGDVGLAILEGAHISEMETTKDASSSYMFDHNEMTEFNITKEQLPLSSTIINAPLTFSDYYELNKEIVNLTLTIIAVIILVALFLITLLLRRNLLIKNEFAKKEQYFANTDMLTDVPNRRAGLIRLDEIIINYDEYKPLTICFIDLDKLKYINDHFGHKQGDEAIITISNVCRQFLKEDQYLCRLGGDEFLLIMPKTNQMGSEAVVEQIRGELMMYNKEASKEYELSISAGITEYDPESHDDINALIEEADQLMYEDKLKKK